VPTRVIATQRGRIILTDDTLVYEESNGSPHRISVKRTDIVRVRTVTHALSFSRTGTELVVEYRGGALRIPHLGRKTASALRKALGF
jgi:hypothetical protein